MWKKLIRKYLFLCETTNNMLILTWPATSPSYATIYLFILYFFALSRCSTCCVILSTKRVFCTLGPTKKKKKKLALWSLRAICHSVIKFGTTSVPLFHLASAFRMQKKGETFNVHKESWCKREQNNRICQTSEDVRCLKSCSSELTGIPIDRPYFTFLWETVSASPWEAETMSLVYAFSWICLSILSEN